MTPALDERARQDVATGIVLAALIAGTGKEAPLALVGEGFEPVAQWLGLAVLASVCILFYRRIALR